MSPLISVILPIYNMESYLPRCLDSILANTYQNLEILCVDDGSKDRSLEILRQYAENDSRIVVIAKENGGVSAARNTGLDHMTGDFACFIDPDDFVHPKYFELLLSAQIQNDVDLVIGGFRNVEEKDLPVEYPDISFAPDMVFPVDCKSVFKQHDLGAYCWGRLYRADLVQDVRFREDVSYAEDTLFVTQVSECHRAMKAAELRAEVYFCFHRKGSLATSAGIEKQAKPAIILAQKAMECPENEPIYLDRAIKFCLDKRNLSAYILLNRDISKKCGSLLRSCWKRMQKSNLYTFKEKLLFTGFIFIPRLYWLYRVITQPFMLHWERVQRKKRREEKRKRKASDKT